MDLLLSALPFAWFLLVVSITPGPNNLMLTASGMNFGYVRSLPHIIGIVSGFLGLLLLCGLGVGAAYQAYPPAQIILKMLGCGYLVYLSWRILTAGKVSVDDASRQRAVPLRFIEAFGFQFINPKAVVFGLAAINVLPEGISQLERSLITALSVLLTVPISCHVWTLFGKLVAQLTRDDRIRRRINAALAILLLATLPMMVL